jgi:hypothetical protein
METYWGLSPCDMSLRWLSHYRDITGEDELTMVRRGPRPEDKYTYCHPWPRSLVDHFGMDGTARRVTIL